MLKLVSLLVTAIVGLGAHNISSGRANVVSLSESGSASVATAPAGVDKDELVTQDPTPVHFARGIITDQTSICINNRTHEHYEGIAISYDETKDALIRGGFNQEEQKIFLALARVEGQNDLRCLGDDKAPYYNELTKDGRHYGESVGLFQIRTIQENTGRGDCRDKLALADNLDRQVSCAMEIRRTQGLHAWSTYKTPKYYKWYGRQY